MSKYILLYLSTKPRLSTSNFGFFSTLTSLKILDRAKAMPAFFALREKKRIPKFYLYIILIWCLFMGLTTSSFTQNSETEKGSNIQYFGKDHFSIEGTVFPDSVKESPYDRFPLAMKEKVREPVWELSKNAAGITIRFLSNSSSISLKWTLLNDKAMPHMALTGIKGIDLYTLYEGNWRYVNTAFPRKKENEAKVIQNMAPEWREFKLFLPLYDGVTHLEVGIDTKSEIKKPLPQTQKPILFYGTSITQGGCASRPGMAHTNIISRKLNREVINFGFSGNGRMEAPINELIAEIDAAFYVIECLQNMEADQIIERTIPLVETIRMQHPNTPILLVENMMFESGFLDRPVENHLLNENQILKKEYQKLLDKGIQNVYFVNCDEALGLDHEGTVDGVHLTDLGFLRYAEHLMKNFKVFGLE